MVSLLSTVGRTGNWYVCGELSRSLHGRNQALYVFKIGLMENFNRSIARSFPGLARNRKGRKHGGRHSINGAIWTITAKLNSRVMLLMAVVITVGVYVAKRDAQRDAERKYEFNIIQSIIKDVALYQEEIENWGYLASMRKY